MDTPDHAPSGLTINDALSAAGQLGFERQFVVADPDGYLLRFHEGLGERPA